MIAGIYDPAQALTKRDAARRLELALSEFGVCSLHQVGPLSAGAGTPADHPPRATPDSSFCFLDGYIPEADSTAAAERLLAARFEAADYPMLARCRGAFAGVIWDAAAERGCLFRDQLGLRPLFVYESGRILYFATEVRPLLALLPRRPVPNPVAVARYLSASNEREDIVPYQGVRRVPGGHVLLLEGGRWSEREYWRPVYRSPYEGSQADLADATREHIASAVARHTHGAERVGIFLSGGLDSTSVAAVAAPGLRARGATLHAYSQTFPNHPTMDESDQIDAVVRHLGVANTQMQVFSGSSLASSLEFLETYELPELSATGFFWRALARRASDDGMDVVLTGDGGDEVFAAPVYLIADALARLRFTTTANLIQSFPNIAHHPWPSVRLRLLRDFGVLPLMPRFAHRSWTLRQDRAARPQYLNVYAHRLLDADNDPRRWRELQGPRWWAAKAHTFARTLAMNGAAELVTRGARLGGIAERLPLLDLDLVEFVLRLPPEHGFDPERTRPDLRRAVAGHLPDAVRLRGQKVDFDAMRGNSLQADMKTIRALLEDPRAPIRGFAGRQEISQLLDTVPRTWGTLSDWGAQVMRLVTADCWLRYQEDRLLPSRLRHSDDLTPPGLVLR